MLLAPGGMRARRRELLGRQLSAIALPILVNAQVIACVSCVWSKGLASHTEVVEQSLVHLTDQSRRTIRAPRPSSFSSMRS